MKTLKKIEDFKGEFKVLEKKEMLNVKGGKTVSWVETRIVDGVTYYDYMSQEYRWDGSSWVKWGPAYRTKSVVAA